VKAVRRDSSLTVLPSLDALEDLEAVSTEDSQMTLDTATDS